MVALVNGTPRTLSLKEMLEKFIEFRSSVIRKRARFELGEFFRFFFFFRACFFSHEGRKRRCSFLTLSFVFSLQKTLMKHQQVKQRPATTS